MLVTSLVESLCTRFDWALTAVHEQRRNFTNFSCPLVGYRFRFLRHITAHVPSSECFIRGIVGLLLFTSSLLRRRHHCCILFTLLSFFTAPGPPPL
jgi:hypothetical protein